MCGSCDSAWRSHTQAENEGWSSAPQVSPTPYLLSISMRLPLFMYIQVITVLYFSVNLKIFWNICQVWWIQTWPCKIEKAKTIARNFGHSPLPALWYKDTFGWYWNWRETRKVGTAQKCPRNVRIPLFLSSPIQYHCFSKIWPLNFIYHVYIL